jgi:hypothetical protein
MMNKEEKFLTAKKLWVVGLVMSSSVTGADG